MLNLGTEMTLICDANPGNQLFPSHSCFATLNMDQNIELQHLKIQEMVIFLMIMI